MQGYTCYHLGGEWESVRYGFGTTYMALLIVVEACKRRKLGMEQSGEEVFCSCWNVLEPL